MRTVLLLAALLATPALADDPLVVGKAAPPIALPNQLNKTVTLADLTAKKRWVLIAFYPKAATPG